MQTVSDAAQFPVSEHLLAKREMSTQARIAEHEKYRRQCRIRIKPSLQLSAIALFFSALMFWHTPDFWLLPTIITGFPLLFAAMEIWGYYRHDRAVKELTRG